MRLFNAFLFLILLWLIFSVTAGAQAPSSKGIPLISSYTADDDDYRGARQTWGLAEDNAGGIYAGNTRYGIQYYNGGGWQLISTPLDEAAVDLRWHQDSGRLLAATKASMGYVKADSLNRPTFQLLAHYDELDFMHDPNRSLQGWHTINDSVYLVMPYAFIELQHQSGKQDGAPFTDPQVVLQLESIVRAAAVIGSSLHLVQDKQPDRILLWEDGRLIPSSLPPAPGPIRELLPGDDDEHRTEILTENGAWHELHEGKWQLIGRMPETASEIKDAVRLPFDQLVIATSADGLILLDRNGGVMQLDTAHGLTGNRLEQLLRDHTGNLWVSGESGMMFIETASPLRSISAQIGQDENITSIATGGEELLLADTRLRRWNPDLELPETLSDELGQITDMRHLPGIGFLIASQYGMFRYEDQNARQPELLHSGQAYRFHASLRKPGRVYAIIDNAAHELQFGDDGALLRTQQFISFDERIYTLTEDSLGNLWAGAGGKGFLRLRPLGEHFTEGDIAVQRYDTSSGVPPGGFNFTFSALGTVGFITSEGIYRYDSETDRLRPDARFDQAFKDNRMRTWPVEEDSQGRIWMDFGARKFGYLDTRQPDADGRFPWVNEPFKRAGDLPDISAIRVTAEGVYFSGGTELSYIAHEQLEAYKPPPAPHSSIYRLTLGPDSLLSGSAMPQQAEIQTGIEPGTRSLRFDYGIQSHHTEHSRRFQTYLEGFDDEWTDFNERSQRSFTSLPPGDYVFKVRSRNIYDETGPAASLAFSILPPWYLTTWAYAGYVLLGIGLVIGLLYLGSRRQRARNKDLERVVAERTEALRQNALTLEQQQKQLQRQDELKNQFFANISHELRTPIMLVKGPLNRMNDAPELDDEQRYWLRTAIENVARMQRRVEEILELTRLDSNRLELHPDSFDLGDFLHRTADGFDSFARDRGLKLMVRVPDHPGSILTDRDKLDIILANLLSNACKFTPEGGQVGLEASIISKNEKQLNIRILITDTGVGMDDAQLKKVFERYYKGSSDSERPGRQSQAEGLGIGMTLTRQLVHALGGRIELSSAPQKGTRVCLEFSFERIITEKTNESSADSIPESLPAPTATVAAKDETSWQARILVVEDHPAMQEYIRALLAVHAQVETAANGKDALQLLNTSEESEEQRFDLIISDIMMPDMDGLELLKKVREHESFAGMPFMFLTALARDLDRLKSLRFGVDDYLEKPFEDDELLYRAQNLIARYRTIRREAQIHTSPEPEDEAEDHKDREGEVFLEEVWTKIYDALDAPDLSVDWLAGELYISSRQLNRRLKRYAGQSASEFIREVRLQQARKKLEASPGVSVAELARQVGFRTPGYFSRLYKQRFGRSPGSRITSK